MIKDELISRILDLLSKFFNNDTLAAVVLYGSYAEDRGTEYSDIDLLIILNKEFSSWREKRQIEVSIRKDTSYIGPLSPRVMTEREFSSALENYDPLVLNILSSGKILYDTGAFEGARGQFEKVENKKVFRMPEGYWEIAL